MEELGGYPQMQYNTKSSTDNNGDEFLNKDISLSDASWFGLALSGIQFLLNNEKKDSNANNNQIQPITTSSTSATSSQNNKKLHILGPGLFKKQLSDIPEYPHKQRRRINHKQNRKYKRKQQTFQCDQDIGDNALTKQALQRFNRNFSHYWHQRSSLHSHNSDDQSTQAGSTQNVDGDGSSTRAIPQNEYAPSMTSSQILHPSQLIAENSNGMTHSKSYPLLHSAEHMQDLENEFTKDSLISAFSNCNTNDNQSELSEEGVRDPSTFIPSPPPMPTTPKLEIAPTESAYKFESLQSFKAVKSWETVQSIQSIHSIETDDDDEQTVKIDEISRCIMQGPSSSMRTLSSLLNDNHFINTHSHAHPQMNFEKQKKLWKLQNKNKYKTKAKANRRYAPSNGSTNSYDIVTIEKDWTDSDQEKCKSEMVSIVSRPLPISTRSNSNNKRKKCKNDNKNKKKKREYSDEENVFSDWSNISSNIGNN